MNCGYPRRSDYRCRGGWRQRSSASVRRSAPFRRGWRSHLASAIVLCRCLSPRPRTLWTNLHLSTSPPPLRNQGHTEPAINRTTAPIVIALAPQIGKTSDNTTTATTVKFHRPFALPPGDVHSSAPRTVYTRTRPAQGLWRGATHRGSSTRKMPAPPDGKHTPGKRGPGTRQIQNLKSES